MARHLPVDVSRLGEKGASLRRERTNDVQGSDERGVIAATTDAGNGMSIHHDMDEAYAA